MPHSKKVSLIIDGVKMYLFFEFGAYVMGRKLARKAKKIVS